ncbi:palmitoyltransferase ZDHHC13-like isoform X3 [Centrocercus urophasianus]|uniref:palmitoyltransferase ZDHHC13-like isoform X3 n=1 Tax=Centrocercus urophasianus TaxID=9002 RepID=UPI001C64DA5C|nr:palmitoyltransferase ZDHHC13-like isoform X3 [Centrocercus urophasianus]
MHVARRVPCEEGAVVSSVGTMFADGRFVSQQCKNHCRGPHRPDVHSCHSICREKDVPVLPALQPITEDPGTCDIVKATQYGMLERCKELVEAGYDVRQADKENVTLLHWAAISNRQELVKYYISKGAVVDQLGGDLNQLPFTGPSDKDTYPWSPYC